jgi:hypothetical protein
MGDNQQIIQLEEGWANEIKAKALNPLEVGSYSPIHNHMAIYA